MGGVGHTVQGSIVSAVYVVGRCGQAGSRESGHLCEWEVGGEDGEQRREQGHEPGHCA